MSWRHVNFKGSPAAERRQNRSGIAAVAWWNGGEIVAEWRQKRGRNAVRAKRENFFFVVDRVWPPPQLPLPPPQLLTHRVLALQSPTTKQPSTLLVHLPSR